MKKSIFLFFAAILCAMSVNAKMIYLKPNGDWSSSNAKFYVWSWGGSKDLGGQMTYMGIGLYGYEVGDNKTCHFTRNDPKSTGLWDKEWNRIADQTINTTNPCCKVTGWTSGTWIAVPSAYIAGATELTGSNWSANAAANKMTKQSDGTWTLTKNIEIAKGGNYEYKVTDGSWDWSFGEGSNNKKINIPAAGKYEVTFTYTPSPENVSATATPIYSVTVNAGEGGSATGTGECKNGASVTINATALENYEFVNWTIADGTGTFANETEASTTFTPISNAIIQANFRSTLTYSLTVQGGTGIESVTGGNNNVTLGESYDITATLTDGYKFVGWTADVAANAEIVNASAASTSVVVKNGSVVLTASAQEFLSTLTTANAYDEGDAGLAIPAANVSEIGVVTTANITATPACVGYVFASWTLTNCERIDGGAENATSITVKSKGDGAAASVVANYTKVPTATVYFVNNKSWSTIKVYAWGGSVGENASWSGLDITANKETEKLGEFDVYSYTVNQGAHANLIFNDGSGDDSKKTSDYVWVDGKYYYMGANKNYAGSTKEEITALLLPNPLATDVYLAGEMTNWGDGKIEFKKATAEATTASVKVNLSAKSYTFQLVIDGTWYGNKSTMKRGGDAVHEGGWSFEDTSYGANCTIVADFPGDYTFTWNLTEKKLTVAYPPLPKHQVTATVNPAETGTVTGIGEYEQGSEATLVATPAPGYAFKNWTVGGTEKSTEATYTFTVTEAVELVANFVPEETHEVTVSYLCGDNPIVGQTAQTLAVGVTTPSTVSAPAITNYKFDSWTLGTGVQSEDATTANPIQITTLASGEYTLAANYTKIELTYMVEVPAGTEKCYIAGEMTTEWSFVEMTKVDDTHFTITIEGATIEHKYKYAAGPAWAYVEKKADGSEADNRTYNANDVVAKWASVYDPSATYVLMGVNGDWDNGIALEVNPHNAAEYRLLCQPIVKANDAIKVVKISKGNKSYCANIADGSVKTEYDSNGNIVLADGIYDFYYKIYEDKIYIATATNCYTRDVTEGKYGTICLPKAATNCNGATFFEVAGKEGDKVFFDEVTTLEAGVPYVFLAEANKIVLSQTGESADEAGKSNSLQGTFSQIDPAEVNVLKDNYMVVNNVIKKCGANCGLEANRAYFIAAELETLGTPSKQVPGRRRVAIGQAPQVATGMENIDASAQPVKMIIDGQLYILRGEKMYDAQGKLVK